MKVKSIAYIDALETWRDGFSFFIPIKVRFSETDMFGHVNNVSPFIYFEEARIEFLKIVGLFNNGEHGIPVAADLQCDYHKQVYFDDKVKLYVKVNHVGNTSFDLHYMGVNEQNEICWTGRGRIVHINPATGISVPLGDSIKELLLSK